MRSFRFSTPVFLFLLTLPVFSLSLQNENKMKHGRPPVFGLMVRYADYRSYSQTKNTFPMKAGYPMWAAGLRSGGVSVSVPRGRWTVEGNLILAFAPEMGSDDGTGRNSVLDGSASGLNRIHFDARLLTRLFRWKGITVRHGPAISLAAERRTLRYHTGVHSETREWNTGLGPALAADLSFRPRISLRTGFEALFYLPWLGRGRRRDFNDGVEFLSLAYHSFFYQTRFRLELTWEAAPGRFFIAGYRRIDQVGFGNDRPAFVADRLVTYKMDRIQAVYLGVAFPVY